MGLVALGLSILITALFRFLAGIIVYVIIGAVVVGQLYHTVECVLLLMSAGGMCRRHRHAVDILVPQEVRPG